MNTLFRGAGPHPAPTLAVLSLAASVILPTSAGAADPPERPATWDMTLDELRAEGLGQYRGDPVPLPPGALPLKQGDAPKKAMRGTIFVNFDGEMLVSGMDDSKTNQTQIPNLVGAFAPYGEGNKRTAVLQAVLADWMPYDVQVTQTRPTSGEYTMNMTGPTNPFGGGVLGIAPLDCDDLQTHSNITYAFHSVDDEFSAPITATTIGQEVAHSYGLEHVDMPEDIMNPFNAGGDPSFIDACLPVVQGGSCPAQHELHCGSPVSQNSHMELLTLFGPGVPDTQEPFVTITSPPDGSVLPADADFQIDVTANDADTAIDNVKLFNHGEALEIDFSEPYGWEVGNAPAGVYEIYVEATDLAGNVAQSQTVTVFVGVAADTGGDESSGDGGSSGSDSGTGGSGGADDDDGGCGCRTQAPAMPLMTMALFGLLGLNRRRRPLV